MSVILFFITSPLFQSLFLYFLFFRLLTSLIILISHVETYLLPWRSNIAMRPAYSCGSCIFPFVYFPSIYSAWILHRIIHSHSITSYIATNHIQPQSCTFRSLITTTILWRVTSIWHCTYCALFTILQPSFWKCSVFFIPILRLTHNPPNKQRDSLKVREIKTN